MIDPVNWARIFAQLARDYGWTYPEIAAMSLDQIYLAMTGGKAPRGGIPVSSDEDVMQLRRNWRKYIG